MMRLHPFLLAAPVFFCGPQSWALSPGDVVFADPCVVAEEGQSIPLYVGLHTGRLAVSSLSFELRFDRSRLRVEKVAPADPGGSWKSLDVSNDGYTFAFELASSAANLTDTTVQVLRLTVRPLVPEGNRVELNVANVQIAHAGEATPQTGRGFGAEITLATMAGPGSVAFLMEQRLSSLAAPSFDAPADGSPVEILDPNTPEARRVLALRPVGDRLVLWTGHWDEDFYHVNGKVVRVEEPSDPRVADRLHAARPRPASPDRP